MKKVALSVLVALLSVAFLPACASEGTYSGIGIKLHQIDENIISFEVHRNGRSLQFNNKDGKFTGAILIQQVLENSPAWKAGIMEGDQLLTVDGEDAVTLGISGVVDKITSKRRLGTVALHLRSTDEYGNTLGEFKTVVKLEKIDETTWPFITRRFKRRKPNPEVNVSYEFYSSHALTYNTKVLKDPANPVSELVDAVNLFWNYSGSYVQTTVLKYLITVIEHEKREYFNPDYIEWKSKVEYRSDGVIDNTQVVLHYFSTSIASEGTPEQ